VPLARLSYDQRGLQVCGYAFESQKVTSMRNESKVKTIAVTISTIIGTLGVIMAIALGRKMAGIQMLTLEVIPTLTMLTVIPTPTPMPRATSTPPLTATPFPTPTPIPTFIPLPTPTATSVPPDLPTQVALLQGEIATLRQELDSLTQRVASNPSPDSVALREDLQSLDQRLAVIEQAVLDNPERALQLTLLNREMDNLKVKYQSDFEGIRQEIQRIYDLNKWFIGLMFTMAIGLLSLAVSNFVKTPERHEEHREQQEQPKKRRSVSTRN